MLFSRWASAGAVVAALALAPAAASAETNAPPSLTTDAAARVTVVSGTHVTIALDATDPDQGDAVHISALFLPPGLRSSRKMGIPLEESSTGGRPQQGPSRSRSQQRITGPLAWR